MREVTGKGLPVRARKVYSFRPDTELAADLKAYATAEHRTSMNEVLAVLVREALTQWWLSHPPQVERTNTGGP